MRLSGGKMTPLSRASLTAKRLFVECLTIGLNKMSRAKESPPTYRDIHWAKCGIHRPSGASRDPRAFDPEQDEVHLSRDTHVRSMVQSPTEAKAFAHSDLHVQG